VKPARIRVNLGGRYAGSWCWATFTAANDRTVSLAVDERDMEGDRMLVDILAENGGEVLIQLPRAGLVGEWVAVVPRSTILMDGTRGGCLLLLVASVLVTILAMVFGLLWMAP
jgi:hypothetical protein